MCVVLRIKAYGKRAYKVDVSSVTTGGILRMRNAMWQVTEVRPIEINQYRLSIKPGSEVKMLMIFIRAQEKLMFWGNAMA